MKRTGEEFGDPAKRARTAEPSKVLHVRGLPSFTTESELVGVVAPFGQVVKCLLLPDKHQAFIQMESIAAATDVLSSLEFTAPSIRSKPIYFQFSSRSEVETSTGGTSSILLITVLNVTVPVTLENIYQICKPYGEVLKIITFTKGVDFQALVQMATQEAAVNAKLFLEGKDMFQGCCHLRVGFSKRSNLVVKQNNHKSRDFTQSAPAQGVGQPAMGPGMGALQQQRGLVQQSGGLAGMPSMGGMPGMPAFGGYGGQGYGNAGTPVVLVNKLTEDKVTPETLFTLFGVYGDVMRVKILFNKRDTAMVQFATGQQARFAVQHLNGCPLHGQTIVVSASKHSDVKLPRTDEGAEGGSELTKDFAGAQGHRYRGRMINPKNVNSPSQVLHVANLHDAATAAELRELFGGQQNAESEAPVAEFFKTSHKMAYVGMASVEEAVHALVSLHNYSLGGYPIRVSFSHKEPSSLVNSDVAETSAV